LKTDLQQFCVADATAQKRIGMGHNRPPKSAPFGLTAAWLRFANGLEVKRLAKLHVRIKRKEQALADLRKQRTKIMNRCIRRMRRSAGKQ
jgi:hypothetical protein